MNAPRDTVRLTLEQILEKMYFCEAACLGPGRVVGPAIGAGVAISGAYLGRFSVIATTKLAARLAADFLAAEADEVTSAQATAIVHEFANIACGATMGAWMPGAEVAFSLPFALSDSELGARWPHRFVVSNPNADLAVELILNAPV